MQPAVSHRSMDVSAILFTKRICGPTIFNLKSAERRLEHTIRS